MPIPPLSAKSIGTGATDAPQARRSPDVRKSIPRRGKNLHGHLEKRGAVGRGIEITDPRRALEDMGRLKRLNRQGTATAGRHDDREEGLPRRDYFPRREVSARLNVSVVPICRDEQNAPAAIPS